MTTSAVVQGILFLHLGILLVVTAHFALWSALFPGLRERGQQRFAAHPWKTTFVGLGISIPVALFAIALLKDGGDDGGKFLGAVISCLWVVWGLVGCPSLAAHVGSLAGAESGDQTVVIRGAAIIVLSWMLPLLGWFLLLPLTLACGVGCCLMSRRGRQQPPATAAQPAADAA